ncbi:MAG TPA: hypothetical protein PLP42_19545 [Acidobacteriota bacterium]|nr:hypothetical protein [Acidobacteriota bacterium]
MKDENKDEIEQACRILKVSADASWSAIQQAFYDARDTWDPKQFEGNERLVREAEEQRHLIAQAYLVLRNHFFPDPLMQEIGGHHDVSLHRPAAASDRPSLVDELFSSSVPKKKTTTEHKSQGEGGGEASSPSLVQDVFAAESKTIRRIPAWLLVLLAITVTVVGSVMVYRSYPSRVAELYEENKPPVPMAEPPPVPPLDLADRAGLVNDPPGTDTENPQVQQSPDRASQPRAQAAAPESTRAKPSAADTESGAKPKLLREPEDLAKEQKAFDVLREKSLAARRLVAGDLDQYRFVEYQVIPKGEGVYFVHILAESKAAGRVSHFVWAVNPDKETARPMSQEARDLDR